MIKDFSIYQDERIDEFNGLRIIQKISGPHFSLDAIILAKFAIAKYGDKVVDLGTGGGIVSLLLASKLNVKDILAIEIQGELADIARKNIALNQLEDKIRIIEDDLRLIPKNYPAGQFDLVISNPPYRKLGTGRINPNPLEAISRHEIKCQLTDVLKASFHLLKEKGRAVYVYPPDRLVDIISQCRKYRLEPKRLQLVYPKIDEEANLVLIEVYKNGQPDLKVLEPMIISGHQIPDFP